MEKKKKWKCACGGIHSDMYWTEAAESLLKATFKNKSGITAFNLFLSANPTKYY